MPATRLHRYRSRTATATSAGWLPRPPRCARPTGTRGRHRRRHGLHPAGLHGQHPGRLLQRLRLTAAAAAAAQPDPVTTGTGSARTSASRIQSAALGSRRAGTSATRRAGHGSQRMRAARLGAGLTVVPAAPSVDALKAVIDNPSGARGEAHLLRSAAPPSAARGRQARPVRGLLPQVRQAVLVHAQAAGRATSSAGSTRSSAPSPTAASAGSTSPATATSPTAGSCSRACSTPATPTRSPPRSPSSSSSPRSSTR